MQWSFDEAADAHLVVYQAGNSERLWYGQVHEPLTALFEYYLKLADIDMNLCVRA
jgi:hypothetical protein